ncbi:ATP-dependent DNA helicase [Acidovorax sp. Leaf76]|uniref:helicase C-terminal domain-containing protein n=1 Tax=unclassified Acidovorax TaxID=2684926 RepID=UPI0006F89505|nr:MULTISPECIES: helicase C-terminal domain-containing protein [unclassified Acidovorax]KQO12639.1 ATP-dependent DNA helicase [Acidovorax sp. Leaf76]KQO30247.1 ATP-dependent DNA helicase [Acidovorax sp. Leaf84]KQS28683.1 ATP-dependent DNA helicase [Acidovorax sp. Leaf191]
MTYTVAVRELCEFTAKQGDLDLRFTPAPTALEGIAGHATVATRRGAGYRAEVALAGQYKTLRVRGRADGVDAAQQRLDEVKTFKGRLDRQPASHRALHWAQARIYGWLLCQQEGWSHIDLALVYFDIGTQKETVFTDRHTAADLQQHFEAQCERFLAWADAQVAHRAVRDAALGALAFPFGTFRAGQRPLAEAVYKAAASGRCLLAQAPTGIGKTMGTLFPLLKAMPGQQIDKVFFLAAKTSGRQMALDALQRLAPPATAAPGLPLRVLELVARDKSCEHPDKACHGESCPLAQGFYDRLPAARAAAVAPATEGGSQAPAPLLQARVREVALAHQVCPYYLSQELARWADVVVGDYNYYFDLGGLLHGLTQANQWRAALLVDEAHNLVERGRKMYTAELRPDSLALARQSPAATRHPAVKNALDKVRRCWVALDKEQTAAGAHYAVFDAFPDKLLAVLQQCGSTLSDHFADHPAEPDAALQAFYFDALHLVRMAELLDTHSLVDITQPHQPTQRPHHPQRTAGKAPAPGGSTLCIRNVVPAPFLQPRLQAAHTSTLFSATLQPARYYGDLLGLPDQHVWVDVESPFASAQLQVQVARHISTRYPDRNASLAPIADLMARQFTARPGNYLAFFSSYEYLQQVADVFERNHPHLPHWRQSRRMLEAEQRQFLDRFTDTSEGIAFAVLGGAFAEGIDLPGRRLIGAFLATLGLPQVNPVNEQIRQRMQALFGDGYDYTYLYPGLQKVVQAAGRVIRTPSDEGVVHLMDDRFGRSEVRALLPTWWQA